MPLGGGGPPPPPPPPPKKFFPPPPQALMAIRDRLRSCWSVTGTSMLKNARQQPHRPASPWPETPSVPSGLMTFRPLVEKREK